VEVYWRIIGTVKSCN